jgi:hypothetical protein
MKNLKNPFRFMRMFPATGLILLLITIISCSCTKKTDEDNNNNAGGGACWGETWLIGTWEGTTPSSVNPFAGTKIRIVFTSAVLKVDDDFQGNPRKIWAYDGVFTWDVGGAEEWSMNFSAQNWANPIEENTIIYECVQMNALNMGMSNISLRISDVTQTFPSHTVNFDWGPTNINTSTPATTIDFYGDVEIDYDGNLIEAEYWPNETPPVQLTKK